MANAGSITSGGDPHANGLRYKVINWTATAGGAVSQPITDIVGTIERVVFMPSPTSGSIPTDNYHVTLLDPFGIDVLGGGGLNRDETNAESMVMTGTTPLLPVATAGTLTFTVANAGSGGSGWVTIMWRR